MAVLSLKVRGFVLISDVLIFVNVWVLGGFPLFRGLVVLLRDQLGGPVVHLFGKFVRFVL